MNEAIKKNSQTEWITTINAAVAANSGERRMRTVGPTQSNGLLSEDDGRDEITVTVQTQQFGQLIQKLVSEYGKIDLLKIDIEGGEHECFASCTESDLDGVEAIGMEYHPNGSRDELFSLIMKHGFSLTRERPDGINSGVAYFNRIAS